MNFIHSALALITGAMGGTALEPAYLDPGSGSLILQTLVAGMLGVGFVIKTQWHQLKRMVLRRPAPGADARDAAPEMSADPDAETREEG